MEVIGVLLIKPALQKVRRDAEKRVRQDVIKALEQEKLPLDQQRRILEPSHRVTWLEESV